MAQPVRELLSAEEHSSGDWVDETTALQISGLSKGALVRRRGRGKSLQAKPRQFMGDGRPRDYWYRRSDVEAIGSAHAPVPQRTLPPADADTTMLLELAMARAEAKEHEMAAATLRIELASTQRELEQRVREIAELRSKNSWLASAVAELGRVQSGATAGEYRSDI